MCCTCDARHHKMDDSNQGGDPGERLIHGFRPRNIHDKWLVYSVDPDPQGIVQIHFVRHQTGYESAELRIRAEVDADGKVQAGKDAMLEEMVWESDYGRVQGVGEFMAKDIVKEACRWVLEVELGDEVKET